MWNVINLNDIPPRNKVVRRTVNAIAFDKDLVEEINSLERQLDEKIEELKKLRKDATSQFCPDNLSNGDIVINTYYDTHYVYTDGELHELDLDL